MAERSLSIEKAVDAAPINQLIHTVGENDVFKTIVALLVHTSEYFLVGNKMSDNQALQIASLFIDHYGNESIEDLMICLKYAKLNRYGQTYNRLDGQIIFGWFQKYLDEKYQVVENLHRKRASDHIEANTSDISEVGATILQEIKGRQVKRSEAKTPTLYNNDSLHYEHFMQVITRADMPQLTDLVKDYKRHEKAGNKYLSHYIKALETEISKRENEN